MNKTDLHISQRLKALLPPLTDEERAQLKANIEADGRVTDPILYWANGSNAIILDGMHRFEIIRGTNIPYTTTPIESVASYEDAEKWIWDHQAGRRNMSRETIGKWYNQIKTSRGGDHRSKVANDTLANAAEHIAAQTGKSPRTVKRLGARDTNLDKCTDAVQKGVNTGKIKATDADIKRLAGLKPDTQNAIARAVRSGTPLKDALPEKAKPPKPAPKKALTGPEAKAAEARAQVKIWADAVGRWLGQSPSIDDYRALWPGSQGNKVVKLATDLYEAMKNWQKAIK